MSLYVFLDTEFAPATATQAPVLLSVGLCSVAGDEFYCEVAVELDDDRRDEFMRTQVLPQLTAFVEVGEQLVQWIEALGAAEVQVCYDYHQDFAFIEQLFDAQGRGVGCAVIPAHVGYLVGQPEGDHASELCFEQLSRARGLQRHHALADALALRARFLAVHGA